MPQGALVRIAGMNVNALYGAWNTSFIPAVSFLCHVPECEAPSLAVPSPVATLKPWRHVYLNGDSEGRKGVPVLTSSFLPFFLCECCLQVTHSLTVLGGGHLPEIDQLL